MTTLAEPITPVRALDGTGARFFEWIRESGEEGRRWVEAYHSEQVQACARLSVRAVAVLRKRRQEEGAALLEGARDAMAALEEGTHPSMYAVLERWYYGALAYLLYCTGDFDGADRTMYRAHEAVVAAVSHERCLLPLAVSCSEFHLNRARVARGRRRWAEMRGHIAVAAEMGTGERPFCTLADGAEVWLSDIRDSLAAVPGVSPEEWGELAYMFDAERNALHVDRIVRQLYRFKGFVVEYP